MALIKNNAQTRFVAMFITLFVAFYYFNIFFWGLVSPGGSYNAFLANHLDYISGLRNLLIALSTKILVAMGYVAIHNADEILVAGRGAIKINYSCFGLGVMSFFAAFVIAYPKPLKRKSIFLIIGLLSIQFLNLIRFVVLALYLGGSRTHLIDHHTIFNIFIYVVISVSLYFWIKEPSANQSHATN